MAPTNSADVATAFQSLWTMLGLASVVPGGLWWGRVDTTASPYATLKITEGEPVYTALRDFMRPFTLQVTAWSNAGGEDAGAIQQAIDTRINNDTLPTARNGTTMSMMKAAGAVEDDPDRRQATDVKVASAKWELWIQTTR